MGGIRDKVSADGLKKDVESTFRAGRDLFSPVNLGSRLAGDQALQQMRLARCIGTVQGAK